MSIARNYKFVTVELTFTALLFISNGELVKNLTYRILFLQPIGKLGDQS